mgnify:CR=1 FL=1
MIVKLEVYFAILNLKYSKLIEKQFVRVYKPLNRTSYNVSIAGSLSRIKSTINQFHGL